MSRRRVTPWQFRCSNSATGTGWERTPCGVLKVATIVEPPSLDRHLSPSVVTSIPMSHVVETLFTRDRDFNPIPLLAEGDALADGGRRYTITLRKE